MMGVLLTAHDIPRDPAPWNTSRHPPGPQSTQKGLWHGARAPEGVLLVRVPYTVPQIKIGRRGPGLPFEHGQLLFFLF